MEENVKKNLVIFGIIALFALSFAGCSLIADATDDVIVGNWQQTSVNGNAPILVYALKFTADNAYTASTAGVTSNTGTWSKSGASYTLVGALFGFVSTTSTITPTFTDSNNTMTYTDASGYVEIYKK